MRNLSFECERTYNEIRNNSQMAKDKNLYIGEMMFCDSNLGLVSDWSEMDASPDIRVSNFVCGG